MTGRPPPPGPPSSCARNPCAAPSPTASRPKTRTRPSSTLPSRTPTCRPWTWQPCPPMPTRSRCSSRCACCLAQAPRLPATAPNTRPGSRRPSRPMPRPRALPNSNRYAANLANGRFLWRNRVGAESVQVQVVQLKDGKAGQAWSFDALAHNLRTLEQPDEKVASLGSVIAQGLEGKAHVLLQITAFVRLGAGQEVFPSQELILDKGSTKKSKTLYQIGEKGQEVAAIHSQKIGNALRTIDTCYDGAQDLGRIALDPYDS